MNKVIVSGNLTDETRNLLLEQKFTEDGETGAMSAIITPDADLESLARCYFELMDSLRVNTSHFQIGGQGFMDQIQTTLLLERVASIASEVGSQSDFKFTFSAG